MEKAATEEILKAEAKGAAERKATAEKAAAEPEPRTAATAKVQEKAQVS